LLSRKGTNVSLADVRALIHRPRVVRERLIFYASFSAYPVAWVFAIFSDPAKSTKFNFEILVEPSTSFYSHTRKNTVCDRELLAFYPVAQTARFFVPSARHSKISSGVLI
jgi:hypothetical protein